MNQSDALGILRLKPGYTPDEAEAAYRRLAQKLHPDKGGSEDAFKALGEAYNLLTGRADTGVKFMSVDSRLRVLFDGIVSRLEPHADPLTAAHNEVMVERARTVGNITSLRADIIATERLFGKLSVEADVPNTYEAALEGRLSSLKKQLEVEGRVIDVFDEILTRLQAYTYDNLVDLELGVDEVSYQIEMQSYLNTEN